MGSYLGLVYFLCGKEEARNAFKEATGMDIMRALGIGTSPIEKMVDHATGYDATVVASFADWVTEYHWGIEEE